MENVCLHFLANIKDCTIKMYCYVYYLTVRIWQVTQKWPDVHICNAIFSFHRHKRISKSNYTIVINTVIVPTGTFERNEIGRFGALKSDSTHHFFRNACAKSGSLRFSQFSGCWLILSVYILMSFDFPY